jgi:hypothetical protein
MLIRPMLQVSDGGAAIGVVCLASNMGRAVNPRLFRDLPGWLLRAQRGFVPPLVAFRFHYERRAFRLKKKVRRDQLISPEAA